MSSHLKNRSSSPPVNTSDGVLYLVSFDDISITVVKNGSIDCPIDVVLIPRTEKACLRDFLVASNLRMSV
ncbi:hypothetical protein D3C72_2373020 [compost metagenome]